MVGDDELIDLIETCFILKTQWNYSLFEIDSLTPMEFDMHYIMIRRELDKKQTAKQHVYNT